MVPSSPFLPCRAGDHHIHGQHRPGAVVTAEYQAVVRAVGADHAGHAGGILLPAAVRHFFNGAGVVQPPAVPGDAHGIKMIGGGLERPGNGACRNAAHLVFTGNAAEQQRHIEFVHSCKDLSLKGNNKRDLLQTLNRPEAVAHKYSNNTIKMPWPLWAKGKRRPGRPKKICGFGIDGPGGMCYDDYTSFCRLIFLCLFSGHGLQARGRLNKPLNGGAEDK